VPVLYAVVAVDTVVLVAVKVVVAHNTVAVHTVQGAHTQFEREEDTTDPAGDNPPKSYPTLWAHNSERIHQKAAVEEPLQIR
jgi:hypothetical protein